MDIVYKRLLDRFIFKLILSIFILPFIIITTNCFFNTTQTGICNSIFNIVYLNAHKTTEYFVFFFMAVILSILGITIYYNLVRKNRDVTIDNNQTNND